MWGCRKCLPIVSVLPAVEDCQLPLCVEWKKGHHIAVNHNQQHVLNIIGALRCRPTAFSFGTTLPQPHNVCVPARDWNVVPKKKAVGRKHKAPKDFESMAYT